MAWSHESSNHPISGADLSNRSKLALDLPKITPRPPVPPKVYKKVLGYISSALSATSTPSRGAAKFRNDISNSPLSTPSKTVRPGPPSTPRTGKSSRVLSDHQGLEEEEVPEWIMPAVRALCKALKWPEAAPHVFAGISSVLKAQKELQTEMRTPSRKRKRIYGNSADDIARARITEGDYTALITVIVFYTISKLDVASEPHDSVQQRRLAIKTLAKYDSQQAQQEDDAIANIERLTQEAQNGWLDMEWYRNISKNDDANGNDAAEVSHSVEDELADDSDAVITGRQAKKLMADDGTTSFRGGLGTMFNDSTDWLSEARKADYVAWKSRIISEINAIESDQSEIRKATPSMT